MTKEQKKQVIDAIAWNLYCARPEAERISLGSSRQDRERVERDFDLLGIREFSEKYQQHIHAERRFAPNAVDSHAAQRMENLYQRKEK